MCRFFVAAVVVFLSTAVPFAKAGLIVLWDSTVDAPEASEHNQSFDQATLLFSPIMADRIISMGGDDAQGDGLESSFHTHEVHPTTQIFLDLRLNGEWNQVLSTTTLPPEAATPISSLTESGPILFDLSMVDGLRWRADPHNGWTFHNFNDGFSGLGTQTFFAFFRPLIGDTFPLDGVIDINDINAVRNNFGLGEITGPPIPGDTFPFDGKVDLGDLNRVRNFFGTSLETTAVPEPASYLLTFPVLCALSLTNRTPAFRNSCNRSSP